MNWKEDRLEALVEFLGRGRSPAYVASSPFRVLNQACIQNGRLELERVKFVSRAHFESLGVTKKTRRGDILVNSTGTGTIGRVGLWDNDKEIAFDGHLTLVRLKQQFDSRFIYYWFDLPQAQSQIMNDCLSGSTNQVELSREPFRQILVRYPTCKSEQAAIGHVLSVADQAVRKTEALIAKSQRIKVGLMQDLLTCGIDERGRLRQASTHRFKPSLVGPIPEEWTCQTVDELLKNGTLLDVQDGNHGELHPKTSEFVRQGVPFVMASDISKGDIDLERCKRITKERCDQLRVGHSQAGDVLVSHKASIGFVALVRESDGFVMLTPQVTYYRIGRRDHLSPSFLRFLLQGHRFQSALLTLAKQSTRDYVGILLQRTISLAFPTSIDEQHSIATILGYADARLRTLTARLNKLERVKTGLMQDLLTGRVSSEQLVQVEPAAGTA